MSDQPRETGLTDEPLRRDVRMLGLELGRVLRQHGSPDIYDLVEDVRHLSKQNRAGNKDAGEELEWKVKELGPDSLEELMRALASFFDLANLAEDRHRVRVLRARERGSHPLPRNESIGAAIEELKDAGYSADQVRDLLQNLDVELVFTAHPTEAKRRTVRTILRRLRNTLIDLDTDNLLPRERHWLFARLRTDLDILWETDLLLPRKPTVLEEVRRSLFVAESIWQVIPWLYRSMREACAKAFPCQPLESPEFLRFGSWIGGDRDGNPYVTHDVTRETLAILRDVALQKHLGECRELLSALSISDKRHRVSDELEIAIDNARSRWSPVADALQWLNPREKYRHWLTVIRYRLEQTTQSDPAEPLPDAAYRGAEDLARDVQLIVRSLRDNGHDDLAGGALQDWVDRIGVFGFHLARLDIREDSRRLNEAVGELMQVLGLANDYANLDEPGRQTLLSQPVEPGVAAKLDPDALSDRTGETWQLFELLHRSVATFGAEALGALIVSMTHHPSDVLTLLWLTRLAAAAAGEPDSPVRLPIVPLFETIDDLRRADRMLDRMLSVPAYAGHVEDTGHTQICMIGYSDSTKDGGYLRANVELYNAQQCLANVATHHGVRLICFHGRGGSLGRGGGPAARGILSLAAESVRGRIRITEQGEVLAERYDDPQIAFRHLEQVTWATLLTSTREDIRPEPAWVPQLDRAADAAFQAYRDLIDQPEFLRYFEHATPIDTIESLPIGSRPARRRGERELANLRAIPYTFAWTQSRHFLTAFFGLGTGLETAGDAGWDAWRAMYQRWPMFQAIIDNAELALAKFDRPIAEKYAALVPDDQPGPGIWDTIREEFERSRDAVLKITGRNELLAGTPWLRRSIRVRNPYVDPINLIQIELIRRLRAPDGELSEEQEDRLNALLRLSVQGIAAGLRTTG